MFLIGVGRIIRCVPVSIDHGLRSHIVFIDLNDVSVRVDLAHVAVICCPVFRIVDLVIVLFI